MTRKTIPATPSSQGRGAPNSASPRTDDTELNRDKIVAAAHKLLQRVGIERFTMRALASELNISPMATYRHLANRDEVLLQVADAVLSKVVLPALSTAEHEFGIALSRINLEDMTRDAEALKS